MKVKEVQERWVPKWKWFKPPKWYIFQWAYNISIDATIYDGDSVAVKATVQKFNIKNKNGRYYPVDLLKEQLSRNDGTIQIQYGFDDTIPNANYIKIKEVNIRGEIKRR